MKDFYEYKPLMITLGIIIITSLSIDKNNFMQNFMGVFFVIFSLFKLINIESFVKNFRKYDLLSQKYSFYGYVYPFIELILGLGYLNGFQLIIVNLITFMIMTVSAFSVIKSIKSGLNLKCACLGTIMNVPLSTVSIIENVGMSLMSIIMLIS